MRKRSLAFIVFVIVLGAVIGTALGEILGLLLPDGVVKQVFLREGMFGFDPATLNLGVFTITLGFTLKLNGIGIVGIGIAAYMLRWYRHDRHF
jgi:hypothetical protein